MEYKETSAKTVDEAITKVCIELGLTSDKLDYEVVDEGSTGFLGLGARPAVIRYREKAFEMPGTEKVEEAPKKEEKSAGSFVSAEDIEARAAAAAQRDKELGITYEEKPRREARDRRDSREGRGGRDRRDRRDNRGRGGRDRRDSRGRGRNLDREIERIGGTIITEEKPYEPSQPKPQRKIAVKNDEQVEELKKTADAFLTDVFKAMSLEVSISYEYEQEDGSLSCIFDGDDMGLLIGKHGQTLDSLQYLTSLVVNKGQDEYVRVKLDTENYRSRRKDTLVNLARNIAYKVKQTRHAIALEPMNPYERRIIHAALQENEYVETYSEGEEPYRHVVVTLKKH